MGYMFCCGYGMNGLQAGGRPFIAQYEKFLIVEGSMALQPNEWPGSGNGMKSCKSGLCEGDEICMNSVSTELCCWSQMRLPPEKGAPVCKCCNKLIKETGYLREQLYSNSASPSAGAEDREMYSLLFHSASLSRSLSSQCQRPKWCFLNHPKDLGLGAEELFSWARRFPLLQRSARK